MEEKINILGGRSLPRRISFISEKYVEEAISNKTGEITSEARALPAYLTAFLRKRSFPVPKILQLLAFAFGLMSVKTRALVAGYSLVMWFVITRFESFTARIQTLDKSHLDKSDALKLVIFTFALFAVELIFLVVAFITIRRLASWHGAEHMAIAAYERGRLEVKDIAKENPVHPLCGGRLFLPLVLTAGISIYISKSLGISMLFVSPFLYELMLQIDGRIGFNKITPFSQASVLLQRFITTKRPDEKEMLTAQRALNELIAAHQKQNQTKNRRRTQC